jgi:hypothetical protein
MWTNNGKFEVPYARDLKPYRQTLVDAFNTHEELTYFEPGYLSELNFYNSGKYGSIAPEEQLKREKLSDKFALSWSEGKDSAGTNFITAWLNNKPVIKFEYGVTNAMFGRGSVYFTINNIFDEKNALKYREEIFAYMKSSGYFKSIKAHHSYYWLKLGLYVTKDDAYDLHKKRLTKTGNMEVWEGDGNYVAIFGPTGLVAYAKRTSTGKIPKFSMVSDHFKDQQLVAQIFALIENQAKRK